MAPPRIPDAPDVLIIGGGINGISTFRELALQGVDVVLIERGDFCEGASAALSRMVHGGLRYLENGEFRLVQESLLERDRLLRNAAHVVFPLPTVVPLGHWWKGTLPTIASFFGAARKPAARPGVMVRLGLTLYDILSWQSRSLARHRGLSRARLARMVPGITPEAVGGVLYHDARVTLPERLGVEMILDTEACTSSRAFTYTELVGAEGDALLWRDRLTGETGRITPRLVVNATGAWVDRVERLLRPGQNRARVQGTKGSHLMIRNVELAAALADHMVYYENRDGRICIAFNHLGLSMVGSTDIRVDDPDSALCGADEKAYMLASLHNVFPDLSISDDQIVHVFTGVRPLPISQAGATARISRDHSVEVDATGPRPVLTLIGGKWTTFRAFGAEVADLALARLGLTRRVGTENLPIGGGRDLPQGAALAAWIEQQAALHGLPRARMDTLVQRYGSRAAMAAAFLVAAPDAPLATAPDHSRRECLWLVAHEKVRDLSDLLMRRTSLGIEGRVTAALMAETAPLLGAALNWTQPETDAAIDRLRATLARHHRVQPART